MITILMLAFFATGAMAVQTESYGWEDGVGTHLGTYGNVGDAINVNDFSHTGDHCLYATEDPNGGTPQIYVAWIANLQDGDVVDASFWTYDDTPGGNPSARISAHYTSDDINDYQGAAGYSPTYPAGTGWEEMPYSWTCDFVSDPDRTALCIEFRLYSPTEDPPSGPFYCDDVTVTAPDHALIFFPDEDPVATEFSSFGSVKALYR